MGHVVTLGRRSIEVSRWVKLQSPPHFAEAEGKKFARANSTGTVITVQTELVRGPCFGVPFQRGRETATVHFGSLLLSVGKSNFAELRPECGEPKPRSEYRPCCTAYQSHYGQPKVRRHLARGTTAAVSLGLGEGLAAINCYYLETEPIGTT